MTKSHVTLEQHQCFICLLTFDTGALLLDTKLRQRFEPHTVTGHGICAECQERIDQGFVACVEAGDPSGQMRTGEIAWVKSDAWPNVFNVPVPEKRMCFVETGVVALLKSKAGVNYDHTQNTG